MAPTRRSTVGLAVAMAAVALAPTAHAHHGRSFGCQGLDFSQYRTAPFTTAEVELWRGEVITSTTAGAAHTIELIADGSVSDVATAPANVASRLAVPADGKYQVRYTFDRPVQLEVACSSPDTDSDGLHDHEENDLGTDPAVADTDGDGLRDGAEVRVHHTDPLDADSDDDGLSDGAEVNDHGTDPNDSDTDDDGLTDGTEVTLGMDPATPFDPLGLVPLPA